MTIFTKTQQPPAVRMSRYLALAKAETRQFIRNKTLMVMAIAFPIGVGILMLYMNNAEQIGGQAVRSAIAMEVFFLITLMFVQFYSVLSMTTTRRDEKVLKRLRTGEAKDVEIIAAIATPGAVISLVLTVVMIAVLVGFTGVTPLTGMVLVVAMALGIVIATALALITSSVTANAEAAQMTSLPVMVLAMVSQSTMRIALPEQIQNVIDRTPFALIGDVAFVEWAGGTMRDVSAGSASAAAPVLGLLYPLLLLVVWAIALVWVAARYMKWETNR